MIKNKKQLKVLVSIFLLIVVIGSIAVPTLAQKNNTTEVLKTTGEESALHSFEEGEAQQPPIPQEIEQVITTPTQIQNPIEAIKAKSDENRKHRLHKQDEYNYYQKDIEDLLLNGASLEDIYLSDQIGNEWLVNPKDLIDTKKKSKESWDKIEKSIASEKEKKLKELKSKHRNIESKFSNQTINAAEQLEILQYIDSNQSGSTEDVFEAFRLDGREGIKKYNAKHSKGKGDMYP